MAFLKHFMGDKMEFIEISGMPLTNDASMLALVTPVVSVIPETTPTSDENIDVV